MKIKWFGHSSFLITADSGTRIITDPYESGAFEGALAYGPIDESADVVTISHDHGDHGYTQAVIGTPILIRGAGEFVASGIEFRGTETFHDPEAGTKRGKNVVYSFVVDDVKVCHCGDLGHVLTDDQAAEIGAVDVLLVPVGSYFTIGPEDAWKVSELLSAKIVIPMHFKTSKCNFPIAPVDDFLKYAPIAKKAGTSEIEISKDKLPQEREVIVLEHAR